MKWKIRVDDISKLTHGLRSGIELTVFYGGRYNATSFPQELEPMDVADRLITLGKNIQKDLEEQKELEIKGG